MKKILIPAILLSVITVSACKFDYPVRSAETDESRVLPAYLANNPLPQNERSRLLPPPPHYVFDLTAVPVVTITISADNWDGILTNYDNNRINEISLPATFKFEKNGVVEIVSNIGFRLRGNTFSRHRPEGSPGMLHDPELPNWHHAHFRVTFETFADHNKFHGLRSINFKWFNNDAIYAREIYCYNLFHLAGVTVAPRSSYCRLYIYVRGDLAPAYFGVYEMVETVDEEFLQARFPGSDEGHLWKCLYPAAMVYSFPHDKMGIEDPDHGYNPCYDYKSKKSELEVAKKQFLDFLYKLNKLDDAAFEKWIAKSFDVDMFLRAYAVNVLVGMWDDYWNNQNNFYFYFDERGKAYFIPYDYDNTLGTSILADAASTDIYNWGAMDKSRPLMWRILSIPKYKELYDFYMTELIRESNGLFDAQASVNRIRGWQAMIKDYVNNDTGEDTELADEPARWGRNYYYRVFTGTWDIVDNEANYFLRRIRFAEEQLEIPVTERTIR